MYWISGLKLLNSVLVTFYLFKIFIQDVIRSLENNESEHVGLDELYGSIKLR